MYFHGFFFSPINLGVQKAFILHYALHCEQILLCVCLSIKKACFKTLVDEVQELEALSKDPGAVVHGKR